MKYRNFGRLNWEVSVLGFGAMRLPILGEEKGKIDEVKATYMLHYAIDNGVNYVDTAYPYHDEQSEIFVGKALTKTYRKKTKIATKLPVWLVEEEKDLDKLLNEQLKKLQTDHIDFYLLHALNKERWENITRFDIFKWAEKVKKEGKIDNLGFSFHDEYPLFKEIVDAYDKWIFTQIQYNYMDENFQAGRKGLEYAASKGLAIVVMEPLKGGKLATRPPKEVQKIWDTALTKRSSVDWALNWVWNHKEVATVLSGMSTLKHVKENIKSASESKADLLTEDELEIINKVKETYKKLSPVPCTDCKYCLPCPSGVNIPKIFQIYNDVKTYGDIKSGKRAYDRMPDEEKADKCTKCGQCEELCPQKIEIQKWLEDIHDYFTK